MEPNEFATVVPLDYGNKRTEFSVIYATLDWEDLGPLLADPAQYLASISSSWRQELEDEVGRVEWAIGPPVTVILEWFGSSRNSLWKLLDFALKLYMVNHKEDRSSERAIASVRERIGVVDILDLVKKLGEPCEIRKALDALFAKANGCLLVEFAVNTHTMMIHYHPPVIPPGYIPRFGGQFTDATLVTVTGEKAMPFTTSSLHFDIGRDPRERAFFILDYLQDFHLALTRALEQSQLSARAGLRTEAGVPAKKFRRGSVKLCCKGDLIKVEKPSKADPPNIAHPPKDFPLPTLILETTPSIPPQALISADNSAPAGPDCQICIEINGVYQADPNVFEPGTTTVKCYVAP